MAVDEHCRVEGLLDVYAAGDVTNVRIKQGGFAARQADTVAAAIASRAGAPIELEPLRAFLHARLLTGGQAGYLETGQRASAAPCGGRRPRSPTAISCRISSPATSSPSRGENAAVSDIVARALAAGGRAPARRPA